MTRGAFTAQGEFLEVPELDLACSCCAGPMKVVAFLEPPQGAVIEKILRHCGTWHPSTPRAPPPEDGWMWKSV